MRPINRRELIKGSGLAALASLVPHRFANAYSPPGPLGFMIHSLRAYVLESIPATLATMASLGYEEVELISFKGFSGTGSREGFGPVASTSPMDLRDMIADAGLIARSIHVRNFELDEPSIGATLDWIHTLGVSHVTIADFGPTEQPGVEWPALFDRLDVLGERVADAGFQLGIHTSNEMWHPYPTGGSVIAALMQRVGDRNCRIQLDLATAQNYAVDSAAFLRANAGRVFGVHLRDAITPLEPVPYLDAAPLGQGDLDWRRILSAAEDTGVELFVVEMQSRGARDPIDAYRQSAEYLRRL